MLIESLSVVSEGKRLDIPFSYILYVQVTDKRCNICVQNGNNIENITVSMTLDNLEIMLPPPRFVRCHRSNIVNLEHVVKVERDFILSTGDKVYIRRGDMAKMKKLWEEYIKIK